MFQIRYEVSTGRVNLITNSERPLPSVEGMNVLTVPARPHFDDRTENLYVKDGELFTKEVEEMPEPLPVSEQVSSRQFFQALAMKGEITQQEALDAVRTGAIPAKIKDLLEYLPTDQQFAAQMLLSGASTFDLNHPLVANFAAAFGWTPDEIKGLWNLAGTL